ncbi:MAG: HDOD domain-containing protein [Terracidiphilus sp.]
MTASREGLKSDGEQRPIPAGGSGSSRRLSGPLLPSTEVAGMQFERRKDEVRIPWAHLRLPPFPQVAIRILQLANNENVQLHQLSDLIATDPGFASEVLMVANSPLYAPRYPATGIMQAIAVLGANQLQGMCLLVGVRTYLGKSLNQPAMRGLWRHNLACALISQQLASAGFMDRDLAYTAGILHDIGRIALGVIRPKEYAALLETHRGPAESILDAERELFGWDHCQTGQKLIADWKLPSDLDAIVSEHHLPRRTDGSWGMTELIKVSCAMADAAGFTAFPGCEAGALPDLLEGLPSRERKRFPPDLGSLAQSVVSGIEAVEAL